MLYVFDIDIYNLFWGDNRPMYEVPQWEILVVVPILGIGAVFLYLAESNFFSDEIFRKHLSKPIFTLHKIISLIGAVGAFILGFGIGAQIGWAFHTGLIVIAVCFAIQLPMIIVALKRYRVARKEC